MKLIRVGIAVGKNNKRGYETLIQVLSEPELFELFTPVIFGSKEAAEEAIATVQPEENITFNVLKDSNDSQDGRINFVDNIDAESDVINISVNAYLDNCIDALVIVSNEIYNTPEKPRLTQAIADAMQHPNEGFIDWFCNGATRTVNVPSLANIETIVKSLRWDYTLIRPRIAIVSHQEELHQEIANLRETGVIAFGPFNPENEETKEIYGHYDALVFCNNAKANGQYKNTLDTKHSYGYISGLPMVLTYTLRAPEASNLKDAIYAAIDIDHARMAYRKATCAPLEKYWNPKGRDDFKIDFSTPED